MKYGIKLESGGGRSSVCEIIVCVVVGVVVEKYMMDVFGIEIVVFISFIGGIDFFFFIFEYLIFVIDFKFYEFFDNIFCEIVDKFFFVCCFD